MSAGRIRTLALLCDRIIRNVLCTVNDSGVLSINNLCLLNDVAKIDSGSRY